MNNSVEQIIDVSKEKYDGWEKNKELNYDKSIYKEKAIKYNLSKLGDYDLPDNVEYALYLYINYCNRFGYNPYDFVRYAISNSVKDGNTVIDADADFKKWLLITYDIRMKYINHLNDMGIDLSSNDKDIIELYKGKLDSVVDCENIISPYSVTMNMENSLLYKNDDTLYKATANTVEKINDNTLFIIQNPYSVTSLLYLLKTLEGTNNKAVISFWGHSKDQNKKRNLLLINDILDYYEIDDLKQVKTRFEEKDGFYTYSFVINTKSLEKEDNYDNLMSKKESNFIKNNMQLLKKRG